MKHVLLALLALSPALAFADAKADLAKLDAGLQACLNAPGHENDMEMKACTYDAFDAADKILNQRYKELTAVLKASSSNQDEANMRKAGLTRLVASERAWFAYRDAEASLESVGSFGGTQESLDYGNAEYELTKARIQALENVAKSL